MYYQDEDSAYVTLLRNENVRVYKFPLGLQVCMALVREFSLEDLIQMDAPLYLDDNDIIFYINASNRKLYLESRNEACILQRKLNNL